MGRDDDTDLSTSLVTSYFYKTWDICYDANLDFCTKVYWLWKSAGEALSWPVQTHFDACDAYNSVLVEPLAGLVTTLGNSLPVAPCLRSTQNAGRLKEEKRLWKAHSFPLVTRDSSRNFSKINSLPTEILSFIFLATKHREGCVVPSHTDYPTAGASVCEPWKHIALNLPPKWYDLRSFFNGQQEIDSRNCSELWSVRARNPPLHSRCIK